MVRSKYLMLTASDDEKAWIKDRANTQHQDISGYVRALIRKDYLSSRPDVTQHLPPMLQGIVGSPPLFKARDRGRPRKATLDKVSNLT